MLAGGEALDQLDVVAIGNVTAAHIHGTVAAQLLSRFSFCLGLCPLVILLVQIELGNAVHGGLAGDEIQEVIAFCSMVRG